MHKNLRAAYTNELYTGILHGFYRSRQVIDSQGDRVNSFSAAFDRFTHCRIRTKRGHHF